MIEILGKEGSGKTTLSNELERRYGYKRIITYTTRPKKNDEMQEVDYRFIDKKTFFMLKHKGFFGETSEYNGWYYGSAKEDYKKNTVLIVTPNGSRQIDKAVNMGNIKKVYLDVPDKILFSRLLNRNDMSIEEAYKKYLYDKGMYAGIEDEVDMCMHNDNEMDFERNIKMIKILEEN